MNSFLLILSALLILVIGALFAAPLFIDWNEYKPAFEAQASELLGRQVKVEGPVHLVILPAPEFRFDRIKVADRNGGFEEPFLEARSVEALVSIGSLLTGRFEARQLALQDPVLRLDIGAGGSGNWSDLGGANAGGTFVPKEVTLDAETIRNGTVTIAKEGTPQYVLHAIEGEASAPSLTGPYKVSASYMYEGRPQQLGFSTSAPGASGLFRLKAVLRDPERRASYLLDGGVTGLGAAPAYDGKLTLRIAEPKPIAAAPAQDASSPEAPKEPASPGTPPPGLPVAAFELKGDLKATLDRAEMPAFDVTLHAKGRPQLMKGQVALTFGERPQVDGSLTARWLDLDILPGATKQEGERSPLGLMQDLTELALQRAAKFGPSSIAVAIEQASVGGDLVSGIDLSAQNDGDAIVIDRLNAVLPGANRLTAAGRIAPGEAGPVFAGPVRVEGAELRPLLRWTAGDREVSGQTASGEFSLAADVAIGSGKLSLANAEGTLSGTSFRGTLDYSGGTERAITLKLDSDRLDLREILGDSVSWQAWLPAKEEAGAERNILAELRDDALTVSLRVGELLLPSIPGGKLDADFTLANDTLDVTALDFVAPGSLALNGKGRIESLSETPSGRVDASLSAQSREALSVAAQLLAFPESVSASKHLGGLVPFDVRVGLVADRAGDVTKSSLNVTGMAGRSQLALTAQAMGKPAELAKAQIEVAGTMTGDKPQVVLGLLFPNLPEDRLAAAAGDGGTLSINARGVPDANVTGRFGLETSAIRIGFEGDGALRDDGMALKGKATVASGQATLGLALLGLDSPPSANNVAFDLTGQIDKTGAVVALPSISGTIGSESVAGEARLDLSGPRTKLSASARAGHINLASLLGTLVAWQRTPSTEEMLGSLGAGAAAVWPARGFALGPVETTEGDLTLTAKTMSLGAPLDIADAALTARMTPQGLSVSALKGRLFGGALSASAELSPRGTGAFLAARADLKDAQLAELTQAVAGAALAKGSFSLRFDVSGEGLSPPGLVAGLSGEGALTLAPGTLQSFNPAPLQQVAMSARKKVKATKEQIAAQAAGVKEKLTQGAYRYDAATIPFEVKNGTLRLEPTRLAGKGLAPTIGGYLELASLKLDSEWTFALEEDLPAVSVVFAGPLDNAAEIAPNVDTVAIESFFTMRRMKEDVERLENLDVSGRTKPKTEDEADPPQAAPAPAPAPGPQPKPVKPAPSADAAPARPVQPAPPPRKTAIPTPPESPQVPATQETQGPAPSEQSSINTELPPLFDPNGDPILVDPAQEAVAPAPRPRPRKPAPRPDDWKKNIPIFGGG